MAYDSRSDKPRTKHNHLYCRSDYTAPPEPVSRDRAIAEGLDELEPPDGPPNVDDYGRNGSPLDGEL
jgi:hypothetical protein